MAKAPLPVSPLAPKGGFPELPRIDGVRFASGAAGVRYQNRTDVMLAEIAAGASVAQGVMGFKGNRAAARQARQVADYNAQVEENNLVILQRARRDQELQVRRQGEQLVGAQRVAVGASGIQERGTPLNIYANAYFGIERDAARIQYASSVDEVRAVAASRKEIMEGRARATTYQYAAMGSLLGGTTQAVSTYGQLGGFDTTGTG